MTLNLFAVWNLSDVDAAIATIATAFYSKHGFIPYRRELEQRRDDLHAMCQEFERNGGAEQFEDVYLALFDGLSYLTLALRGRAINANHLATARNHLEDVRRLGGDL